MNREPLGSRMKRYEESTNFKIIPRTPIMLRIDGKAFSNLTKKLKLKKPYDIDFSTWMAETAVAIANEIQGCMLGYTQSDEMTFIIRTDQSDNTTPWFDNRVQKIVSVAASVASASFNEFVPYLKSESGCLVFENGRAKKAVKAIFDCRVWPMPSMTEVFNNFIWRQRDCVKNSISSACYYEVGEALGKKTARKLMHRKTQSEQQEILFQETGINWSTYPEEFKNGIVIFRETVTITNDNGVAIRKRWTYKAAPIFTSEEGRAWLTRVLTPER